MKSALCANHSFYHDTHSNSSRKRIIIYLLYYFQTKRIVYRIYTYRLIFTFESTEGGGRLNKKNNRNENSNDEETDEYRNIVDAARFDGDPVRQFSYARYTTTVLRERSGKHVSIRPPSGTRLGSPSWNVSEVLVKMAPANACERVVHNVLVASRRSQCTCAHGRTG